jgi:hypothetical protein
MNGASEPYQRCSIEDQIDAYGHPNEERTCTAPVSKEEKTQKDSHSSRDKCPSPSRELNETRCHDAKYPTDEKEGSQ